MPRPARLASLMEPDRVGAVLARRRIAARLCMGQSIAEMARLEGVWVARMVEIVHHPAIRALATLWMAFLLRLRRVTDLEPFLGHATRLAEHELETGNGPVADFLCRLWAAAGSPARGLLEYVARRFARLALLDAVRRKRAPRGEDEPVPAAKAPLTPEQAALRAKLAEYLESSTPIEVTRHGQTIGFYIPVPKHPNQSERAALIEAGRRMQEEMIRLGITEDELSLDFKAWRKNQNAA